MALHHHHPFSQAFSGKNCRRGATVTASLPAAFQPKHAGFSWSPCHCYSSPLLPAMESMHSAAGPSSPSFSGRQRMGVVCMAHPRRVARVSSLIQREISNLFVTDQVLAGAICPERALGAAEISAVASVTDVYVSNDLQVVKVYISIYSDPRGKKRAMNRLKKLEGYTRTQIGQRVTLRLTPEIRFEYDDSQDQAELIQKVIGTQDVERLKRELELEQQEAHSGGVQGNGSEGFFDEYEKGIEAEEEDEDEEEELDSRPRDRRQFVVGSTEAQMMQPGPFDDLFTGPEDDDVLVGSSNDQDRTSRNRAKRQRRKEQQQAKKQGAQN